MIFLPILGSLVQLVVLGLIIVLIVRAVGRRGGGTGRDSTGVTIRRFFQYALMLAVLGVVAAGIAGLIEVILPRRGEFLGDDSETLARSLAFLVVGGPVLAALAVWTQRLFAADPGEHRSLGWAMYLTGALTGSLLIGGFALFRTLRWVLAESSFDPQATALALVAAGVWGGHWWLADRFGWAPRLELNLIIGSAAGLVGTAVAAGFGAGAALGELYDAAFDTFVTGGLADDLRVAGAGALVAVPVWWWHWPRRALHLGRTLLWHGYVLLFGVLGALIAGMVAAGIVLFVVLDWFVGDPDRAAGAFFDPLPGALAVLAVGAAGWWYHRLVLAARPIHQERVEIDRVYEYLLAGVGLAAAASGAVTLIAALVEVLTPGGTTLAGGGETDALVYGLTVLGIGVPLWLTYWRRLGRLTAADPRAERASPTRRAYLLVLTGIGALVGVFSMLAITIVALEDLLDGRAGAETVRDLRVALGLTATAAAVAWYHWSVLHADRVLAPAAPRPAVRDVVLVSANGADVAAAISDRLGVRVRTWHRLDAPAGEDLPVQAVVDAVAAETHEHVMVLAGAGGGFEVVPFDDR